MSPSASPPDSTVSPTNSKPMTTSDIRNQPELWYKLNVFIYDLFNFDTNVDSNARLEQICDTSYIGSPYFSDEQVTILKFSITGTQFQNRCVNDIIEQTLDERLNRRMEKRKESGDYRVCAAHDIGILMEKMFGVRVKELKKDKRFMKLMGSNGINLGGDSWGQHQHTGKKR